MKMNDNLQKIAEETIKAGAIHRTLWNEAIEQLEDEGWYDFYDEHEIPVPINDLAIAIYLLWEEWRDEVIQ